MEQTLRNPYKSEKLADSFLLPDPPPTAASLIVTIYGDAIEPRGGVLWMGNLIDLCARFSISETRVRTAVSRLVGGGQLVGEREGRRSFYRLTPEARREYLAAARVLFGGEPPASGYTIAFSVPPAAQKPMQTEGFAEAGPGIWLGADRPRPDLPGVVFKAHPQTGDADLLELCMRLWPLDMFADRYRDFLDRYEPVKQALVAGLTLGPESALSARLAMVHAYRGIVLRDPRLPSTALPDNWPGRDAKILFSHLYRALSPAADSHIGAIFSNASGALPVRTPATDKRLADLGEAGG